MPQRYKSRKTMNSSPGDVFIGKIAGSNVGGSSNGGGSSSVVASGSGSVSSERSASVTRRSQTPQPSGSGFSKHNNTSRNQADLQRGRSAKQKKGPKLADESSRRKENDQQLIDYELGREYGAPSPTARNKRGEISLNHLLNFTFPPRRQGQNSSGSSSSKRRSNYHEPYNKERFVNANFRFVMSEDGDYSVNLADPDVIVDWEKIVQVVDVTSKQPSCPICLSQPVVSPRVTKCGHVYCMPCILHYLALGDRKWRKCPICYDAIYPRDLKRAMFIPANQVVGETPKKESDGLDWILMKRAMNSTVSLPRTVYDQWSLSSSSSEHPPLSSFPTASVHSKLMVSSPEHKLEMLTRDRDALQTALVLATEEEELLAAAVKKRTFTVAAVGSVGWAGPVGYGPPIPQTPEPESTGGEKMFVEMALKNAEEECEAIVQKYKHLKGRMSSSPINPLSFVLGTPDYSTLQLGSSHKSQTSWRSFDTHEEPKPVDDRTSETHVSIDSEFQPFQFDSDALETESLAAVGTPPIPTYARPAVSTPIPANAPPQDGFYYFYRSADGQHVYMHPMDIKVLKHEYGSYDRFPDTLHVRNVIGVRESTVTEDLRKRCKYLAHLPLGCDVVFCELDLKGLVSEETLAVFQKELSQRERRSKKDDKKSGGNDDDSLKQRRRRQRRQSAGSLVSSPDHEDGDDGDPAAHFEAEWPLAARMGTSPATMAAILNSLGEEDTGIPTGSTPPLTLGSDFVPPSSSSGRSFASMAGTGSGAWTRRANRDDDEEEEDEDGGWRLEIDAALRDVAAGGAGKGGKGSKGKKKNLVLVSNGGRRGRI